MARRLGADGTEGPHRHAGHQPDRHQAGHHRHPDPRAEEEQGGHRPRPGAEPQQGHRPLEGDPEGGQRAGWSAGRGELRLLELVEGLSNRGADAAARPLLLLLLTGRPDREVPDPGRGGEEAPPVQAVQQQPDTDRAGGRQQREEPEQAGDGPLEEAGFRGSRSGAGRLGVDGDIGHRLDDVAVEAGEEPEAVLALAAMVVGVARGLAAERLVLLEQRDLEAPLHQFVGRGQPGDPTAEHGHLLPSYSFHRNRSLTGLPCEGPRVPVA